MSLDPDVEGPVARSGGELESAGTPGRSPGTLDGSTLHGSLADPVLSAMNFLNEVTLRFPEAVSFAPGRPYEGLFDPDQIAVDLAGYAEHLRDGLGLDPAGVREALFQYGRTAGQIRELVARTVANDEGLRVAPEAVVVTVGAQEGMLLVLRALAAGPDDVVLVTSPCYVGITGAARLLDVAVVPVPEGPAGPDPAAVAAVAARERAAGRRPRAYYVVPDFANPSGATMPVANRHELLRVAAEQDLLVIEDNPYGFFGGDAAARPTLKLLDTDRRVVYLGSFAKTCFPGARVGYVLADQEVGWPDGTVTLLAAELAKIKSMTTVNTPSISQAAIGGMLLRHGCRLREATEPVAAFYRANLERLLAGLEAAFPAGERERLGVRWNAPGGGFFVVVEVPFPADDAALRRSAQEHGVLWTPMAPFYLDGGGRHQLRLSCSYVDPADLDDGVRRLAGFVRAEAARAASVPAG